MSAYSDESRRRRKQRIRKTVNGSGSRPRLSVFRSSLHMYAQVVDDDLGVTLVSASTLPGDLGEFEGHRGNVSGAQAVGRLIAERALAANIHQVVFDRNGFLYHGRVKALAEAAREAGLEF